jgi:hypothetical protein
VGGHLDRSFVGDVELNEGDVQALIAQRRLGLAAAAGVAGAEPDLEPLGGELAAGGAANSPVAAGDEGCDHGWTFPEWGRLD